MAKVALIQAVETTGIRELYAGSTGLSFLSSHLKSKGHDVRVIDVNVPGETHHEFQGTSQKEIAAVVNDFHPDYVGLTVTESGVENVTSMLTKLRKSGNGIIYVIGGPEVTANPKRTLEKTGADLAIMGEGTSTLQEIIQGNLNIPGIARISDGEFISSGFAHYRPDLWSLDVSVVPELEQAQIITSLGCQGECTFCTTSESFPYLVVRSLDDVIRDMQALADSREVELFAIMDDNFLVDPNRIVELDKMMEEQGLDQLIHFQARTDSILRAKEQIAQVKDRVFSIQIGIESFLESQLQRMGKGIIPEQNHRVIKELQDIGMKVDIYLILADKDSTLQELRETSEVFAQHPEYLLLVNGATNWIYQNEEHKYPDFAELYALTFNALNIFNSYPLMYDAQLSFRQGKEVLSRRKREIARYFKRLHNLLGRSASGQISIDKADQELVFRYADIVNTMVNLYRSRSPNGLTRRLRQKIAGIPGFYDAGGLREVAYQARNCLGLANDLLPGL